MRQVATINSSYQRRMYGHCFVVLEHRLRRSRINVFSCLGEPVWIMDQISKNKFTSWGCLIASSRRKILRDFCLLKSFSNFMTQEVSWPSLAGATWCSAAGASWCTRVRSPFSGRFYLYLIFIILIQYLSYDPGLWGLWPNDKQMNWPSQYKNLISLDLCIEALSIIKQS